MVHEDVPETSPRRSRVKNANNASTTGTRPREDRWTDFCSSLLRMGSARKYISRDNYLAYKVGFSFQQVQIAYVYIPFFSRAPIRVAQAWPLLAQKPNGLMSIFSPALLKGVF